MVVFHDSQSQPIDPAETLNQIVARHPEALGVLRRWGLDTCCGGVLPLQAAAEHHGLHLDDVLAALRIQDGVR